MKGPFYLGDVLGPLRYFGACFRCGSQFMSTRDQVWMLPSGRLICKHCAHK
jgi:formylmethanofuran dehydrogenase subunit E